MKYYDWVYYYTEKTNHLHLGVADKFLLRRYILTFNEEHKNSIGLFADIKKFLIDMGYNSKKLDDLIETTKKEKKRDKYNVLERKRI